MAVAERALDDEPTDLAEHHRLALALADAVMTLPADLTDDTVRALRQAYTDDQLVALVLLVLKFNTQKINVALGTHRWIGSDEIGTMHWNADGSFVSAGPRAHGAADASH